VFIMTARRSTGLALVVLIAGGCADPGPRALVTIRVQDEAYRPEHLLLTWTAPQPTALQDVRVPATGELPRTGAELATVRIDLNAARPGDRQVTVRGMRGGRPVSGAMASIPWDPDRQVEVTLTLGCLPAAEPGAGCPAGDGPDGGTDPLSVADALPSDGAPDDGPAAPPMDGAPDAEPDLPAVLAADVAPDVAADLAVDRASPPPPRRDASGRDAPPSLPDASPDSSGAPLDVAPPPPPPGVDLTSDLVLYLKLDDGAPSGTPRDSSGNANLAILANLDLRQAWVPGHSGQAIALPGGATPGWISVEGSASLDQIAGDLSISLWVRATPDPAGSGTILTRGASAGGALYSVQLSGGRPVVRLNTSQAAPGLAASAAALPADRWVHLAFVYDREHVFLYLDGRPAGAGAHQLGFAPELTPLLIGGSQGNGTVVDPFAGQLDEIAVYARALKVPEVRALAAGFQPQPR
jgi:hypothetical protein